MTRLEVYDTTYDKLDKLSDEHDVTIPELISAMLECFEDNDGKDYL